MDVTVFSVFVLYCTLVSTLCSASLYDPHLFPSKGPFFEGWYLRITDFNNLNSVGLLFGSVLPDPKVSVTGPLVLASILTRNCDVSRTCKLVSNDGAFKLSDLSVKVQGKNVTSDPETKTPANFIWQVDSGNEGGFLQQIGNNTEVNFRLGDISFKMKATSPVSWSPDGLGPEGYLGFLPLPLHWFVFSLGSKLEYYEIQNVTSGKGYRGTNGVVHLEKNWGKSFPKKWIWAEGALDNKTNASFALSGGQVDFWKFSVNAHLIGYRNPSEGISIDFRPPNIGVSVEIDGCSGSLKIDANSAYYKLELNITAKNESFSSCLFGPEVNGFHRACVESYDATATVRVSKRDFLFQNTQVDTQTFENVALEFGGGYVCGKRCTENIGL